MELIPVYAMLAVLVGYFAIHVISRRFDAYAPVWLFLCGYLQVYMIQALSYHEWAVTVRGEDVVARANGRALWALLLFLAVYHCGIPSALARCFPEPPHRWKLSWICVLSPLLALWGMYCAAVLIRAGMGDGFGDVSPEEALFRSFPVVMLVGADLLIVSSRSGGKSRPLFLWAGVGIAVLYVLLWMFNGKRSHALIGLLSASCAYYISRFRRPSWPVLISIACTGALLVGLALGWRFKQGNYDHSIGGFLQFVGDFDPAFVLQCANMKESEEHEGEYISKETEEYGGYLLMLDTVPERSDYDYGAPYIRVVSTFIPRIVWRDKPYFGREKWIQAWQAGSELKRSDGFTGPAIGLLGATQLNGGAVATVIVVSILALCLRTCYEFFRRHQANTWVQAWWALTYYNAWFTVVCDDPLTWFYYVWGFTCLPILTLLWFANRGRERALAGAPTQCQWGSLYARVQ